MAFKNPFQSKRVRDVSPPDAAAPTMFEQVGGWGDATPTNLLPEDMPSEREQRSAGATALAEWYRARDAERVEAMNAQLANVQRGHDYSRGLRYRDGA